jgi:hypothetical protein
MMMFPGLGADYLVYMVLELLFPVLNGLIIFGIATFFYKKFIYDPHPNAELEKKLDRIIELLEAEKNQ